MTQSIALIELQPKFRRYEDIDGKVYHVTCRETEAQGIEFLCPQCYIANGHSNVGTHVVLCWSKDRGTPDDATPGPGRWRWTTDEFSTLSLEGEIGTDSVWLTSGCGWHGYIRNGKAELTV